MYVVCWVIQSQAGVYSCTTASDHNFVIKLFEFQFKICMHEIEDLSNILRLHINQLEHC